MNRIQNNIVLQLAAVYANAITAGRCRSAKYKHESVVLDHRNLVCLLFLYHDNYSFDTN